MLPNATGTLVLSTDLATSGPTVLTTCVDGIRGLECRQSSRRDWRRVRSESNREMRLPKTAACGAEVCAPASAIKEVSCLELRPAPLGVGSSYKRDRASSTPGRTQRLLLRRAALV